MVELAHQTGSAEGRRYQKLIENIQDTVTVVDASGAPIWTSAVSRGDLGYETAFWHDADLFDLVHPDDRPGIEAKLGKILTDDQLMVRGETRLRRPDGTYGHVGYSAVNRLDDVDIAGIVITARPVDDEVILRQEREERQAELEAALADRAQFIAAVSHEMRSPLHAILGITELVLSSSSLTSDTERHLDSINREATALRMMLDELLDFSKISAKRLELLTEPFSPAAVADAIGQAHGADATKKGLDFKVTIDPAVPLALLGDEHRLRQIIVNLVTNGIKYTATGTVELSVRPLDGKIRFAVVDTGPGIPEEAWPNLFEPYRQARQADTFKGTGLGLVITKQLVELMDGTLHFETSPSGTSFFADIPFAEARRKSDIAGVVTKPPTQPATAVANVLVVDDSNVNLMLASSQLERLGHYATTVSSGTAALDLLATQSFDVILMDWHMPQMDGLEATRRIRASESDARRTPIIATTASVMSGDRETCLEAGMDDYLPKPVSLDDLAEMIGRWATPDRQPAVESESEVIIEQATVAQLIADLGDATVVATVIGTFLEELPSWKSDLIEGVAQGDMARARRAAHTLKSTCALLGASELAAICTEFEATAETVQLAAPLIPEFVRQTDRATEELTGLHRQLTSSHSTPNITNAEEPQ